MITQDVYWFCNMQDKTFVEITKHEATHQRLIDGKGWRRLKHLARLKDAWDLHIASLWPSDQVLGIPFEYSLCYDGGNFVLYVDAETPAEDIEKAKQKLRQDRDVVTLGVRILTRVPCELAPA